MDRSDFLKICQQVSMISGNGKFGLKTNVPKNLQVTYMDVSYYPKSYTMWFDENGNVKNSVTLHALTSNCEITCDLDKVKEANA